MGTEPLTIQNLVRSGSRRGKSLTETFRHLTKTSIDEAVIDGELVSFASGRPDFCLSKEKPTDSSAHGL